MVTTNNDLATKLVSSSGSSCDAIYELAKAVKAFAAMCETESQREMQRSLAAKLFELASDNREAEEATF